MFCRYVLRTTDVDAGREFYSALGIALPSAQEETESPLEVWPLHERARALGAPAHWLGHIAVASAEACAERLVALGGERLGPAVQTRSGIHFATLRDPFGAVIAVRQCAARVAHEPVAWHQLHTKDAERAADVYSGLFGWAQGETLSALDTEGGHRLFAFQGGGEVVGSIANTALWPGVHPHWLFYFPVTDIEAAVARVRALGGAARDPVSVALPGGPAHLSACEDPQGAAFGLFGVAATHSD